jgi:phage tail-like protein
VTPYSEGGVTTFQRQVIGVTKWPNIVMKRGLVRDTKFLKTLAKGLRWNAQIIQFGYELEVVCRWAMSNGYLVKWEGPEFDVGKNEIAVESVEWAHEGLVFLPPEGSTPAATPPAATPAATPPAPPINAAVSFPSNSSTLPKPNAQLDAVAKTLKDNPDKKVKVEADTDSTGSASYNKTLSQQRADAVKQYLIDGGTPAGQIVSAIGYGKERSMAAIGDNKNDSSWRKTEVTDA